MFSAMMASDCEAREPRWPTFGLMLVEADLRRPLTGGAAQSASGTSLLDYVKALAMTMMEAHDRLYVEQADFARTIAIPTLGVGTTEFGIIPARVDALFDAGRAAAATFLDRWDFDAYIRAFRSGPRSSRRDTVAQAVGSAA